MPYQAKSQYSFDICKFPGVGAPRERHPIEKLSNKETHEVYAYGDLVIKIHPPDLREEELILRTKTISEDELRRVFLQPLANAPVQTGHQWATVWPRAKPLQAHRPEDVDWEGCATLLAALHSASPAATAESAAPQARFVQRLLRSMDTLSSFARCSFSQDIRKAFETIPIDGLVTKKVTYVHGDFHPGQVVLYQGEHLLIDIDDFGVGNPAWDLARPAAWYLAGLLPKECWARFLNAYVSAGGNAFANGKAVWQELELPARASIVQMAASVLTRAKKAHRGLEDYEMAYVVACQRIVKHFNERKLQ